METLTAGKYIANEDTTILYHFQLGGGIKGRKVKKGEIVNAVGTMNDVNTQSVCTLETLNRIEVNSFLKLFTKIK